MFYLLTYLLTTTSVAIGCIYAMHTMRTNNNNNLYFARDRWLRQNVITQIFYHTSHDHTVYSTVMCLSQVGVLLKWLNVGWGKQHCTTAHGLFSDAKDLSEIQMGSPRTGVPNVGRVGWRWRISTNKLAISRKHYKTQFLLNINRKPYALCQMVTLPTTLSQWCKWDEKSRDLFSQCLGLVL